MILGVLMKQNNETQMFEGQEILKYYKENPNSEEIIKIVYGDPVYWLFP